MAKKKDRIVRVRYDEQEDAFVVEYVNENNADWQFESSYQCHVIKEQDDDSDPEFIHYGIICKLRQMVDLGYKFIG